MEAKIVNLKADRDFIWSFENSGPCFLYPAGDWNRQLKVDPFPAYAHDAALVEAETKRAMEAFPIDRDVTFVCVDREFESRTNGFTDIGHNYAGKEDATGSKPWTATIVLSGKRIPIHPAMTRYLVAHEYGHVVSKYLQWKQGDKEEAEYAKGGMYARYREMRGIDTPDPKSYGGGWHATTSELFANDFRILVVGAEKEFWPHPGFARPEEVPAVVEFWQEARKFANVSSMLREAQNVPA